MKKNIVFVSALLLLPVCSAVLCSRSSDVLALTESEQAYLDNLTSGVSSDNAGSEASYRTAPADDAWYMGRIRRFPFFHYDPYSASYYPYADPYMDAYGYPWRYYDDDHHDHDWYKHHGRSSSTLSNVLDNMRQRRHDRWENFQTFMLESRENRLERAENIRDSLQDVFSRERSFGVQDNRQDDFGTRLPVREHRAMGARGHDTGNLFRGGRR